MQIITNLAHISNISKFRTSINVNIHVRNLAETNIIL